MKELQGFLKEKISGEQRTVILGAGSVLRSDDAAGMVFIELLSKRVSQDGLLLISGSTAPENFTGVIKDFAPRRLFLVDAAQMGLEPGEFRILTMDEIEGLTFSTHMLPLPVMLHYLEMETGCEVILIGIQPKNTGVGLTMCGEVREGVERLVQMFSECFRSV